MPQVSDLGVPWGGGGGGGVGGVNFFSKFNGGAKRSNFIKSELQSQFQRF